MEQTEIGARTERVRMLIEVANDVAISLGSTVERVLGQGSLASEGCGSAGADCLAPEQQPSSLSLLDAALDDLETRLRRASELSARMSAL